MKKIIICLLAILMLIGCTPKEADAFKLEVKEDEIEGIVGEFDPYANLEYEDGVDLKVINSFDAKSLGTQTVVISGQKGEDFKNVEYKVTIKGIVAKKDVIEIAVGQIFDPRSNFEANVDYVLNEEEFDLTKEGEYTVKAINEEYANYLSEYTLIVRATADEIINQDDNSENENSGNGSENGGSSGNNSSGTVTPPAGGKQVSDMIAVKNDYLEYQKGKVPANYWSDNIEKLRECTLSLISKVQISPYGDYRVTVRGVDSNNNYQDVTFVVLEYTQDCSQYWVVDEEAWDETERVWVVDKPRVPAVYETVEIITAYFYRDGELIETVVTDLRDYDNDFDAWYAWYRNHSTEIGSSYGNYKVDFNKVEVSPAIPEEGHYEYTIIAHHDEVGHWETPPGC